MTRLAVEQVKAVVIHAAHDLRIGEEPMSPPAAGEVEVAIGVGGICGTDLHYYHEGGFGTVRLRQPMILGHEVAGYVRSIGPDVTSVRTGQLVAINPSRPCRECAWCQRGLQNHCRNMRFYGSAMRFPHVHGAFRERIVVEEAQCFAVPDETRPGDAAQAEPFAVALHAVRRAGALMGKEVLVTGAGPIGALVVLAARLQGAARIVVTDVVDEPLAKAALVGADAVVNVAREAGGLARHSSGGDGFDVMFEASGSPAAFLAGLDTLRPRGILVQIGLGAKLEFPPNMITGMEIDLRGTFRFNEEFAWAVALIGSGRVDLAPLITQTYPVERAVEAFDMASDRSRAMKVQLVFSAG